MSATIQQINDPVWAEQVARNAFLCEPAGLRPDDHPRDYALYRAGFAAAINVFTLWFRTGQIAPESDTEVTGAGS